MRGNKLPSYVHDANVAGLAQAAAPKPVKRPARPDNTPDAQWVVDRIIALEGDLAAQTALFEALPLDVQDEVWRLMP